MGKIAMLRELWRRTDGAAMVEAAFAFPVLILMMCGVFEVGYFLLLNQKLQNAALNTADLTSRVDTISQGEVSDLFAAAYEVIKPFDFSTSGTIILTSVSADADDLPEVFWQVKQPADSVMDSVVGIPGAPAVLDNEITVRNQDTIIVSEVFYHYEPFLMGIVPEMDLRKEAYFRPRLGTLREIED